jgi:hypothetical protein
MTSRIEGSFLSHANWLRAFATLAGYTTVPRVSAKKALTAQRAGVLASPTLGDTPRGSPDLAAVRRSLSNAWGTELLLALSREYATEDELIRIANNWGAVQVYYVAYHAFQAYLVANGDARPETHSKTQRMFADRWARRAVQMPPWTFAAGENRFFNGPPGRTVDVSVHLWKTCDAVNCWDIAGRALKSTREDVIPEAVRAKRDTKRRNARRVWEREEEARIAAGRRPRRTPTFALPRLRVGEKEAVRRNVRPYTAMDYLYRLRIKSNYEDSTMFTEGPTDESSSKLVHRDMVRLAASVMLMHELHVKKLIGRAAMTKMIEGWIGSSMPSGRTLGLALRRDVILA